METKGAFLIGQAIVNSIGAAFQHANVYAKGLKDNDSRKRDVRKTLTEGLHSLGETYTKGVTEDEHCQNIADLGTS
jgi:hypothetical protein